MLGIFIGDRGVSVVELNEEHALPPKLAADPHTGVDIFKLVSIFPAEVNGTAEAVAEYRQVTRFAASFRALEPTECEKSD